MVRAGLAVLLVTAGLGLAGCGSDTDAAAPSDQITDLTRLDQLRAAYEADEGSARLVLLLSPT